MNRLFPRGSRPAIVLIAVGVLAFVGNLGLLPIRNIGELWPLIVAAWGLSLVADARNPRTIVWGATLIAWGGLLTLGHLGLLPIHSGMLWPLWLIGAGLSMLFRGGSYTPRAWRIPAAGAGPDRSPFRDLDANAVFGSVKRRVDTANFERADLNTAFGELKVDLRGATIAPGHTAVIDANAAFGAVKLRVPETWRVVVDGTAIFGAYEDKTVPPRPTPGIDPPTLTVTGNVAFGAVEIEN